MKRIKILFFYYLFFQYFCFVFYCFVTFIGFFYFFYFQFRYIPYSRTGFRKVFSFVFILEYVNEDHSKVSLHSSNGVFVLCFDEGKREKLQRLTNYYVNFFLLHFHRSAGHCFTIHLWLLDCTIADSTFHLLLLQTANCTYISVTRFPSEYYKYVAYFYRFEFRIAFILIVADAKEMILMWLFINRFLTIHVVKHSIIFAATIVYCICTE